MATLPMFLVVLFWIVVGAIIAFRMSKKSTRRTRTPRPRTKTRKVTVEEIVPSSVRYLLRKGVSVADVKDFVLRSEERRLIFVSRGRVEIACTLELPEKEVSEFNGWRFDCTAIILKTETGIEIEIDFVEMPNSPVPWVHRNSRAADIAKLRKEQGVNVLTPKVA